MRVLGIDPGTATTGWGVVWAKDRATNQIVACGCVKTEANKTLDVRLVEIYDGIQLIIKKYKPDVVVIEELFFAKNTKTAIAVGHARGVAMLAGSKMKLPVFEYTPLQVKQAVVGYGRAEKNQVQAMLKAIFKCKDIPTQDDTADALAIALTHIQTRRYRASA